MVSYVAGALTELTRVVDNRDQFYASGGVQALLAYQMYTDAQLIVNVNNTIANCALHPPSLASVSLSAPQLREQFTVHSFVHIRLLMLTMTERIMYDENVQNIQ